MKADTRIAYHARSRNASFEGALETTAADLPPTPSPAWLVLNPSHQCWSLLTCLPTSIWLASTAVQQEENQIAWLNDRN